TQPWNDVVLALFSIAAPAPVRDSPGLRLRRRSLLGRRSSRLFPLARHELRSERALCFVLVVRAASETDVRNGRSTSPRNGHDMVELDVIARLTPAPRVADERAAAAIALPNGVPHTLRDVPSVAFVDPA